MRRAFCFILIFSLRASAQQSGWELIEANDFIAARAAFQKELQQNPNNEVALAGMLFCTETVHEEEPYAQYAHRLMRAGWQAP